jgi:drug/metabolite transporter (DMT)-like permease
MFDYFLIFLSVIFFVIGQLLMKQGMLVVGKMEPDKIIPGLIKACLNPWVLGGMFLFTASTIIWLIIISRKDLGYAYALMASAYILIMFFSWLFFHENVNLLRWIGVLVITLGVILVARS